MLYEIFNHVHDSNVMQRVLQLLDTDYLIMELGLEAIQTAFVQQRCLQVIYLYVPGPRIAFVEEGNQWHPSHMRGKKMLVENGVVQRLVLLAQSVCAEVRDEAIKVLRKAI